MQLALSMLRAADGSCTQSTASVGLIRIDAWSHAVMRPDRGRRNYRNCKKRVWGEGRPQAVPAERGLDTEAALKLNIAPTAASFHEVPATGQHSNAEPGSAGS